MSLVSRKWRGAAAGLAICGCAVAAAAPGWAGYAAFVVDADSGAVLHRENADTRNYPASLAKMMTLYLAFESIDHGVVALDTRLPVSARAAARPPSRIGLRAGQSISLRDAIRTLAAKSANDVATVIAEYFSGGEAQFAQLMTNRARALGMSRTTFRNASGLPDSRQLTTARDVATLARALYRRFPHHTHFFANRSVTYRGTRYRNTNRLLGAYPGMDGVKTGYIHASGFNLAASARRDGAHLIAVVMGGKTSRSRNARMRTLLDRAFARVASGRAALAEVRRPRPKPVAWTPPGAVPGGAADGWSVQLGAFADPGKAEQMLDLARFLAPAPLAGGAGIVEALAGPDGTVFRARHTGLGEDAARRTCRTILPHGLPCAIVPAPTS